MTLYQPRAGHKNLKLNIKHWRSISLNSLEKIDLQDVEFFVVTEKNLEEQIARISKMQDGTFVIFGMTPQDYENMAFNFKSCVDIYGNRKK